MGASKAKKTDVRQYAVRHFIEALIAEVQDGQCFVPFLGSGVSSASGIIMGMEFTNYLAYVTSIVIGDGHPADSADAADSRKKRHRLFDQGWPPLPNQADIDEAIEWIRSSFQAICDRTGWVINWDDEHFIHSLTRSKDRPEDPISASLSQPPIPLALCSRHAAPQAETLERLKRMFEWRRPPGDSGTPADVEDYFMQDSLTQGERIHEKAIRALADWKATLTLLSRVHVDADDRLTLGGEQAAIIDAFNQFITRGRQPNLSHQMIAHLSTPMRFHAILSTNFDDLIETAFKDQGIPLAIMAVTTTGALPSHHAVAAQDTLVKLHGQFHETRADKSTDEEPQDADKETFAAYMQRGKGHPHRHADHSADAPTDRLLVIGYSGSDHRCVQLIRHWLETAKTPHSDDALVYWICHNDADVAKVKRLFRSESLARRIIITEYSRPDYLLFELYQRLCYALPPGSNSYEFPHATPPHRADLFTSPPAARHNPSHQTPELSREQTEHVIKDCIVSCVHGAPYAANAKVARIVRWKPVHRSNTATPAATTAWLIDASTVVAGGAALAYEELTRKPSRKVLWFELNDVMDGDELFRDVVRTLSVRCGRFTTQHVALHPQAVGSIAEAVGPDEDHNQPRADLKRQADRIARHVTEMLRDYRVSPESVVIMLYGRDGYGSCAGIVPTDWEKKHFRQLHTLIEGLAIAGVTVIYFPLTAKRAQYRQAVMQQVIKKFTDPRSPPSAEQTPWPHDPHAQSILFSETTKGNGTSPELHRYAKALSQVSVVTEELLRPFVAATPRSDSKGSIVTEKLLRPFVAATPPPDSKGSSTSVIGDDPFQQTTLRHEDHDFIHWLYALTLFRQSRHPSALFSEAVYPSPFEDNICGIDNDYLRYQRTSRWVQRLGNLEIFHAKPGGALWAHRDIQTILNAITARFITPKHPEHNLSARSSKIHYGIGDWYQKAFFSSGHITPLIEAIHHFVQSSLTAPCFKVNSPLQPPPELLAKIRARRFITGFAQAEKTLLIGWESLKYWQSSAVEVSWLGTNGRDKVHDHAVEALRDIGTSSLEDHCNKALKSFLNTLHAASDTIVATGASAINTSARAKSIRSTYTGNEYIDDRNDFANLHTWKQLGAPSQLDEELNKLLAAVTGSTRWSSIHAVLAKKPHHRKIAALKGRIFEHVLASSDRPISDILRVVAESAFLLLRRAKVIRHATEKQPVEAWVVVSRYCHIGLDGCKHLPVDQYQGELTLKAMFHQIYSVALANLGRFQEARRHLTDSQSALARSTQKTRADQAIASIRHAEVAVTEAFWIQQVVRFKEQDWKSGLTSHKFLYFSAQNLGENSNTDTSSSTADILHLKRDSDPSLSHYFEKKCKLAPPHLSRRTRKAHLEGRYSDLVRFSSRHFAVLLDEAALHLSRAEYLLRGASHSVHWWFQTHLLRLRIYGLLKGLQDEAYRCLVFRHGTLDDGIRDSFLRATRAADEEPFRLLRCVKYYRFAVRTSMQASNESFLDAYCRIAGVSPMNTRRALSVDVLRKGFITLMQAFPDFFTADQVLEFDKECEGEGSDADRLKVITQRVDIMPQDVNYLIDAWKGEMESLRKAVEYSTSAAAPATNSSP